MIEVGVEATLYPTDEPLDFETLAGDEISMHPVLSWDQEVIEGVTDGQEMQLVVKGVGTLAINHNDLLDALITLAGRRTGTLLSGAFTVAGLREALNHREVVDA